jgi:hypothetical protein
VSISLLWSKFQVIIVSCSARMDDAGHVRDVDAKE